MKTKILKLKSLVETIVETIEEQILSGELKPGARIAEQKLCEQLGVSRSPVREAFIILESQGFLVKQPRKGVTVAMTTFKKAVDAYTIRANLESLATYLTVKNSTPALVAQLKKLNREVEQACSAGNKKKYYRLNELFHETVIKECDNEQLIQMLAVFAKHTARYRKEVLSIPGRMEESIKNHNILIKSLEAGDAEGAERIRKESILANIILLKPRYEKEKYVEDQF